MGKSEIDKKQILYKQRINACHGEIFFAKFITSTGGIRKSPVFIVSSSLDKNDDVVICSCTSQPKRSIFDITVELRKTTNIRTNKIYTITRNQLAFRVTKLDIDKLQEVDRALKSALEL